MRLNQLQFLVELKKQGSISKAAQHLFSSQPSLSAAVKELEDELGYPVIKRSKKGVSFTSLGESVLEMVGGVLSPALAGIVSGLVGISNVMLGLTVVPVIIFVVKIKKGLSRELLR